MTKGPEAFRTISEASDEVGVAQHVLRFWETRFTFIRPMKRAGGRRFYRPRDIEMLSALKKLLYEDGLTIKQVQELHRRTRPRVSESQGDVSHVEIVRDDRILGLEAALAALEAARRRLDGLLSVR